MKPYIIPCMCIIIIKVLKDWHLVIGVLILFGINLVILIIGAAVKILRPFPEEVPDTERPTGTTVCNIRTYP